jgi:Na+/phosphate symporter
MIIVISLLFAVLGMFLYFASTNAKVVEIGRVTYFAGLLVFLWHLAEKAISFLK